MSKFIDMIKTHDVEVSFTYQRSTRSEDDEVCGVSFYLPLGDGEQLVNDLYNQLLVELGKTQKSHLIPLTASAPAPSTGCR